MPLSFSKKTCVLNASALLAGIALGLGGCKSYVIRVPFISTLATAPVTGPATNSAALSPAGVPTTAVAMTMATASTKPAPEPIVRVPVPKTTYLPQEDVEKIWNEPTFQKQFIASYGINSDIEPKLNDDDIKVLQDVQKLIGDLDIAATELEKHTTEESSARLDYTLANIRFQQDHLDDALDNYKRALNKFPGYRACYKNMGLIYARQGKADDAINAFTKMIEMGGGDAYSYGLLGYSYATKKDYQAAEVAYRNALLLQPKSTEWRLGLTRAVYQQQKYEDTVTLLESLIDQYPDKPEFWLLQANSFLNMKQPLKAAEDIEIVDRMGKSTPDALYMLGDIYVDQGLNTIAAGAYGRGIVKDSERLTAGAGAATKPGAESDPQVTKAFTRAKRSAELLASRGASGDAEAVLAQVHKSFDALLADGDRRTLLKLEARLSMAQTGGTAETAKVLLEIVDKLDPLDGEALMLVASYFTRQNEPEKAAIYYQRAASISSYEVEASLRLAQLYVKQRHFSDALPLLRLAQEKRPREDVARFVEQVEKAARQEALSNTGKGTSQ